MKFSAALAAMMVSSASASCAEFLSTSTEALIVQYSEQGLKVIRGVGDPVLLGDMGLELRFRQITEGADNQMIDRVLADWSTLEKWK